MVPTIHKYENSMSMIKQLRDDELKIVAEFIRDHIFVPSLNWKTTVFLVLLPVAMRIVLPGEHLRLIMLNMSSHKMKGKINCMVVSRDLIALYGMPK
jgi:hypothetical protein